MSVSSRLQRPSVRGSVFRYGAWAVDAEHGVLTCGYSLDGREFTERVTMAPGPRWRTDAARAAARLVFLLAGVSYYKTAAPPVIDLGPTALTDAELALLREFYRQGLGEFAYRNTLDLTPLRIEAHRADAASSVTVHAKNHSHHSLRPSCLNSVSVCNARKAPEPSRGEGSGVRARRPRMDFICC